MLGGLNFDTIWQIAPENFWGDWSKGPPAGAKVWSNLEENHYDSVTADPICLKF